MVILLVEEVRLRLSAGELRLRAIPKRSRDKIPYSWGQEIKSPALTESSFLLLRVLSNSEQHWKIYYFYLFIFSHSFLSFCRNWFVADSFVSLFLFLLCEQVMFTFKWGRLWWRQRLIFLFFLVTGTKAQAQSFVTEWMRKERKEIEGGWICYY